MAPLVVSIITIFAIACATVVAFLVLHQLGGITKEIGALREEVKEEIEKVNDKIDSLGEEMKEDMEGLRQEMKEDMEGLRQEMKEDMEQMKGEIMEQMGAPKKLRSVRNAAICAVSVEISPPSQYGNTRACGTLASINGTKVVITNKHVVEDANKTCARQIVQVKSVDGSDVPISPHSEVRVTDEHDLAIIPVDASADISRLHFCTIAIREADLHDHIYGLSLREHGTHAVDGTVRAMLDTKGVIAGDFQGTHGFSGTGYFLNGELTAVHRGDGEFVHFDAEELYEEVYTANEHIFGSVVKSFKDVLEKGLDISYEGDTRYEGDIFKFFKNSGRRMVHFFKKAPLKDDIPHAKSTVSASEKEVEAFGTKLKRFTNMMSRNPTAHLVKAQMVNEPSRSLLPDQCQA